MQTGKHLAGGKFTASHTSVIAAAFAPTRAAAGLSTVSKISLGIIKVVQNGLTSIKFIDEETCLLAKVRGRSAIQEIRIYCQDIEAVKCVMLQALPH